MEQLNNIVKVTQLVVNGEAGIRIRLFDYRVCDLYWVYCQLIG